MKKRLSILILMLLPAWVFSQSSPVTWELSSHKTGEKQYIIQLKGSIASGWHVYAAFDSALGLEPVTVNVNNQHISIGEAGVNLGDEKGNLQLLADLHDLHDYADPLFDNKKLKEYAGKIWLEEKIFVSGTVPTSIKIIIRGFASNKDSFQPIEETRELLLEGGVAGPASSLKLASVNLQHPVAVCGGKIKAGGNGWSVFLLGIAGGLLALLTPCVFPMIPVTVSFFTGKAHTRKIGIRNGLLYGIFILTIYLLASLPFHLMSHGDPQLFNTISTSPAVNIFFFVIFIVFALSFFGLFELRLPSALGNRSDHRSGLGSTGGIFFMALTLVIVSFSCTGPLLGSLLVGSIGSQVGAWQLTAGMAGFGVALGAPFAFFALFPGLMKALPKSGAWMDIVKKVLAFVELALALKFLSNADLVGHWGLLKREVFIAIWMGISICLSLYLLGVFRERRYQSYNNGNNDWGIFWTRTIGGLVVLVFTAYLTLGLTNSPLANLSLLSGFPPPISYSLYVKEKTKGLHARAINDYKKALALSKAQHKPLLLDFTGWACVNCRKMEEQVWTQPAIEALIRDRFILVSLYVDDRHRLAQPFSYQPASGVAKEINTAGDQWATFESENFKQVTQPLYVVLSPDEKLMNDPAGYTPSAENYRRWLECALEAYHLKNR